MVGRAKQSKEVVGRAKQRRRRQGKQSKGRLGKTRHDTEGKARASDLEFVSLSLENKGHSASVSGADIKVPSGGIVQQDISVLSPSV